MSTANRTLESDGRTPRLHVALLVLLALGSVLASWVGIDYQLPHVSHFDETVYHTQYRAFVEHDAEPEARRFFSAYPTAFARGAALLPRFEASGSEGGLSGELSAAARDHVFLRRLVAVLAALIVPATWLLGRRFLSSGWSLVVSACAVTSLMFVSFAAQARPHALVTVAIVFAVVASIDVARRGTFRASLWAGFACGASTAVLHSGVATLLPLFAAHALRLPRDGRRAAWRMAAALVPFAALFLLANPGFLPKILSLPTGQGGAAFLLSHDAGWQRFRGGGAASVLRAFANHDPLVGLLALVGVTVLVVQGVRRSEWFRGARDEFVVVLAFCAPYLLALLLFEDTQFRFALPLFPFAALIAVLGLREIRRYGAVLAGVLLATQLSCVLQLVRLRCRADTHEQAAAWLEAHAHRSTARIVLSPWVELPLVRNPSALADHTLASNEEVAPWLDHQRAMTTPRLEEMGWSLLDLPLRRGKQRAEFTADPVGFVRGLDADYVVLDVRDGADRPLMNAVRDAVRSAGRLAARFTPRGGDAPSGRPLDPYVAGERWEGEILVRDIWGAEAFGACLEVYRLER